MEVISMIKKNLARSIFYNSDRSDLAYNDKRCVHEANTQMKNLITIKLCLLLVVMSVCQGAKCVQSDSSKNNDSKALTDEELMDAVQKQTFNYFWDGAETNSGLARERFHIDNPENDEHIITTGGSGFGVMALLVGIERGYITREQGLVRFTKILNFLEKADRFHGVFPHWWDGETGKVKPFGRKDNGGDLVESSFLIQGLLCVHQYYINGNAEEKKIAARIDKLWREMEFDWHRNGQNVLYWHWSPSYAWEMNFPVRGWNECMIMYILAAASPTHGVPAEVYHEGWAGDGKIAEASEVEGFSLQLMQQVKPIGPMFWEHYSFLGLDPRGLKDKYADYWQENVNQTLINRAYCIRNPKEYKGYGENCWGLTASYSVKGYNAHAPIERDDHGVITPTAALSSIPYTPEYSLKAMRHFYTNLGEKIWGKYGFYDAFSETGDWYPQRYLAIDQGTIPVMIENYRTQLLWNLFMSHPDVQKGLNKLGFESPHLK